MNNEPNGASIDMILASQHENANRVTLRQKVYRFGAAILASVGLGVGASALIDSEPAVVPAEAAPCDRVIDVCDGQTIVYEDPIDEEAPPVTNVSGVTFPTKGEETTTTRPQETTTTRPQETTTTRPQETTTTRPQETTTTRPQETTTTRPQETTTTQPEATTTTKPEQTTTTSTTTTTTTQPPVISVEPPARPGNRD